MNVDDKLNFFLKNLEDSISNSFEPTKDKSLNKMDKVPMNMRKVFNKKSKITNE